jgi:hypothetical protein
VGWRGWKIQERVFKKGSGVRGGRFRMIFLKMVDYASLIHPTMTMLCMDFSTKKKPGRFPRRAFII